MQHSPLARGVSVTRVLTTALLRIFKHKGEVRSLGLLAYAILFAWQGDGIVILELEVAWKGLVWKDYIGDD
ncbi:hypothetical protein CEXT_415041 [Caerostris extrusa]|uniref:Uncharacterized protein n=1 Tax=Caerostris extrusa TaxID=172846 RepID=A0AAV4NSC7_CAEEX|nr:hypothetical protein CEXT_415041 [Caerostris extrusa]